MKKLSLMMLLSIVLVGCSAISEPPLPTNGFEIEFDNHMKKDLYINSVDATMLTDLFTPLNKTVAEQSNKIVKQSIRNFSIPTVEGGEVKFEYQRMTESTFAIYKVIDGTTTKYVPLSIGRNNKGEYLVMVQLDIGIITPEAEIAQKLRVALKDSTNNLIQNTILGAGILSFKKTATAASRSIETPVLQNALK